MLGDNVSISQALVVTVFSMLIVFATLYIISLILGGFKSVFYKDNSKKKEVSKDNSNIEQKQNIDKGTVEDNLDEEMEIVAVITAALAQSLSVSPADIRIKAINRIPQTSPAWAVAGRQKQVSNKL